MGSNCSVPLKRAVDTRWSARKEAVSCLKKVFSRVVDTLENFTDEEETQESREEADYKRFHILSEVVITQKYLQQKRSGPYSVCVKD